jgi:hypothetical protein
VAARLAGNVGTAAARECSTVAGARWPACGRAWPVVGWQLRRGRLGLSIGDCLIDFMIFLWAPLLE